MKKLTLQQLAILIDRKLNVESQHWQASYKENHKVLRDLGYLDEKGYISQKGEQLMHQIEAKLTVVIPQESVFHPYKGEIKLLPVVTETKLMAEAAN